MPKEFKFYNIGAADTMDTTKEKLDINGFRCGSGKATFLGIRTVQKQRNGGKTTEKFKKIMALDKDLEDYGEGLNYEEIY